MTVQMELPATGLDETPRPTLHVVSEESQEAVAAAAALETPEVGEEITVRILKGIDDSVSGFTAVKGETFLGHIDAEGDVYVPWQDAGGKPQEIYLEGWEFEVVESLPGEEETATEAAAKATEAAPAAGGCADDPSDQPVPTTSQAEPATPPVLAHSQALELYETIPDAAVKRTGERERYLRDKSAMEERLASLTIEEMKLKEQAKLCKKEREVLAERLSNLIDGWERGPAPDAATPEPAAAGGDVITAAGEPETSGESADPAGQLPVVDATPVAETDQDRQARYQRVLEAADIKELSLPKAVEERLVESAVGNLWSLETLRGDISQGKAKWPKGIGEAKITKIETAISEWVARNRATWEATAQVESPQRTAAEIDADNHRLADERDAAQDAEVAANAVSPPTTRPAADHDPLDDL